MKLLRIRQKFLAGFMAVMLALVMGAGFSAVTVKAASGTVYTCSITPSYSHPVTGVIEDSGGEANYTTGQGMVEGAVYTTGMLEVTDGGSYYLTFRMSLMDYASNHSFLVQNVGDSGWSTPGMSVTANGSDSNGTTEDICIQVPSENCVVRGSMYVEPMGRDVIFYFYPGNYAEGNSSGMTATMVTEAAGTSAGESDAQAASDGTVSQTGQTAADETTSQTAAESESVQAGQTVSGTTSGTTAQTAQNEAGAGADTSETLSGSIAEPAAVQSSADTETDSELNDAQGLSLSTASQSSSETSGNTKGAGSTVLVLTAAITISGLILLAVGAGIVYYYRKNWNRWGGGDDDE